MVPRAGKRPLFPFGFGLSYANFALSDLAVNAGGSTVTASATVRNVSERGGAATLQFYVSGPKSANVATAPRRVGRVDLKPGEDRQATISIDPRPARNVRRGSAALANRAGCLSVNGRIRI